MKSPKALPPNELKVLDDDDLNALRDTYEQAIDSIDGQDIETEASKRARQHYVNAVGHIVTILASRKRSLS